MTGTGRAVKIEHIDKYDSERKEGGNMGNRPKKVEFYLGGFGRAIPLLTAAAKIGRASCRERVLRLV